MSRAVSPISTHRVLLFFHLPQAFCILTESMTRGTILFSLQLKIYSSPTETSSRQTTNVSSGHFRVSFLLKKLSLSVSMLVFVVYRAEQVSRDTSVSR